MLLSRKKIYETYREAFKELPVTMNPYVQNSSPNFWLSCILINKESSVTPAMIMERLSSENIESRPIWKPMHLQPVFVDRDFLSLNNEDVGGEIFERGLCLPSDIKITDEEQAMVVKLVRGCFN